jgi:hypothetical protein
MCAVIVLVAGAPFTNVIETLTRELYRNSANTSTWGKNRQILFVFLYFSLLWLPHLIFVVNSDLMNLLCVACSDLTSGHFFLILCTFS